MNKDTLLSDDVREAAFKQLQGELRDMIKVKLDAINNDYVAIMKLFIANQAARKLGSAAGISDEQSAEIAGLRKRIEARQIELADLEARRNALQSVQDHPRDLQDAIWDYRF